MTIETSPGYAQFLELLRWCDETWINAIQASQKWWKEKLKLKDVRTIKRYWAQARKDGILETIRRYRRTSIQIFKGGRHDAAQMSLFDEAIESSHCEPCPHSGPTVVSSTPRVRTVYSTLIVTKVKEVFRGWKRRKTPDELQDELIAGMLEGLC